MTIFRGALSDQRGIALPLALAVLFVVAGLAAVAARGAINASHQTYRDSNVKRAFQAANGGIDTAIYQLNILQPAIDECVVRNSGDGTLETRRVDGTGWCQAQSEDLGGNAGYTVQTSRSTSMAFNSNGQVMTQRSIVSTGAVNGILRRINVVVSAPAGNPLFPKGFAVVSSNSVSFGQSVTITGHLGSNGNITLGNTARVNGNATPGPAGKSVTLNQSSSVSGSKSPALIPFSFAPVNQRGANTYNDNGRIGSADPWTDSGNISWSTATRVLRLTNAATLTLTGDTYSFCRIEMSGQSKIRIAARPVGQPLRIYLDTPENCGGAAGMGSVSLTQNASFENLNSDPATFALLVSGSAAKATSITFGQTGGTVLPVGLYAPYSTISLQNSVQVLGGVVGRQVQMANTAAATYDPKILQIAEDALLVYRGGDYVECTSLATSTVPNSGC